ncbi:hypothetical protein RQ831_15820 [Roseomonas gilardii]|uniref:Phage Tail Collar Domain n=1 Tax=Roseomonas gilardii TaxID=257708 RepID=A0ABU3MHR9_9PROT|nr:hypothetical protein [Roseomonas gilardii]MDT8332529.1 hypothetical protein [Roseomonas gilardii]
MAIESASTLDQLDTSSPTDDDYVTEGAGQLRLIKSVLQNTFPDVAGTVAGTHGALSRAGAAFAAENVLKLPAPSTGDEGAQIDLAGSASNPDWHTDVLGTKYRIFSTAKDGSSATVHMEVDRTSGATGFAGPVTAGGGLFENGARLVPRGVISMFWGASAPAGWAVCDGMNGTPDLRGLFVFAASPDLPVGAVVGTHLQTVDTASAGWHSHGIQAAGGHNHGGGTGEAGQHSHGGQTQETQLTEAQMPRHAHDIALPSGSGVSGGGMTGIAGEGVAFRRSQEAGSGAGHAHGISADGNHAHGIEADGNHTHGMDGAGTHTHRVSFDNRPRAAALLYIMKL